MKKNKKGVSTTTNGRKNISKKRDIWNRFKRNRNALIGMAITIIFVFIAVFAPLLVDYDEEVIKVDVPNRLQLPGGEHPLGTDEAGRDILARLIYASRMSLAIGVMAVTCSIAAGIVLGSIAGYYGGKIETVIMRICDIFDGVPSFLLALTITAAFGASVFTLMLAIAIGGFAGQSRIIRGAVLTVKGQEYVEAAKALGAKNWQIILHHIIPNCIAVIIVQFSVKIAEGILTASALSFLGLGVLPPDPEWGAMLAGGRAYLLDMLGDGLRDSLDPRLKR